MTKENKALVRRWFEEVWNQGRSEVIDELMAPEAIAHGLVDEKGAELRGPAGFKPFHQRLRGAFPDMVITVEDLIAEDDKVAARCRVRGTHLGDHLGMPATRRPIEMSGIAILRIKNSRLVEAWNNFDFLALQQQIG
jgi:steroid delta-isomerase-like uncharacterized protein